MSYKSNLILGALLMASTGLAISAPASARTAMPPKATMSTSQTEETTARSFITEANRSSGVGRGSEACSDAAYRADPRCFSN